MRNDLCGPYFFTDTSNQKFHNKNMQSCRLSLGSVSQEQLIRSRAEGRNAKAREEASASHAVTPLPFLSTVIMNNAKEYGAASVLLPTQSTAIILHNWSHCASSAFKKYLPFLTPNKDEPWEAAKFIHAQVWLSSLEVPKFWSPD